MTRQEEYQDDRWKARAEQIRELDHHRCALCGAKNVMLHVHHLSYPPPPFHLWDAADNELVTLCKDCHVEIHQSITRPTLTEERELIGYTKGCSRSCRQCRRLVQPYLLEDWEICQYPDSKPCDIFAEIVKCDDCTFFDKCKVDEGIYACSDYLQKRCQFCTHYHEYGKMHYWCDVTNESISWSDECFSCDNKYFVCIVNTPEEMKKHLKRK